MRALFFAGNHADVDILKPRVLQKLMQLHFAEPEPVLSVEFTRLFEAMAEEVPQARTYEAWTEFPRIIEIPVN